MVVMAFENSLRDSHNLRLVVAISYKYVSPPLDLPVFCDSFNHGSRLTSAKLTAGGILGGYIFCSGKLSIFPNNILPSN